MNEETRRGTARKLPLKASLAAIALLGLGVAAGATAIHAGGPSVEMAPIRPVAISSLTNSDSVVTVKGRVAEIYGPMFVLQDGSGRALIDAGRKHGLFGMGSSSVVANGATVTIQGHFRDGMVRASFLVGQDGTVTALGPVGGPRHGPHGPGRGGPDGPRGPEGRDGPPPPADGAAPPPPVDGAAPPPPASGAALPPPPANDAPAPAAATNSAT